MNIKTENYDGIDLFKFFFALCVVACHVHPYNTQITSPLSVLTFLSTILNVAVPFFFIANGFFIAGKMKVPIENGENLFVVWTTLKKYLLLYMIWTAIYLPITIYYYVVSKSSPLGIVYNFLDGLLFTGEHWYSWSLWYLCALIWTLAMIMFFVKYKYSGKVLIVVSVALFIFAYIYGHSLSSLDFLPIKLFKTIFGETGRQFTAPLYLLIGFFLNKTKSSALMGIVLTILGFAVSPLFPSVGSGYYSEPSLLLIATGVFIIALSLRLPNSKIFLFFRTSSMVLYFMHLLVYVFICLAFFGTIIDGLPMYLTVTAICLLISIPIFFLDQRKNRFIRLLFSGRWRK